MGPDRSAPEGGGEAHYFVTLIHGTFAEQGLLAEGGVEAPRGGQRGARRIGCHVCAVWLRRGRLTPGQGRRGPGMRRFLRERLREHPDSRHLIVAHSHGGNVALYGLRRRKSRPSLAGLVCLGTPFLHFTAGDLNQVAKRNAWRAGSVGMIAIGLGSWFLLLGSGANAQGYYRGPIIPLGVALLGIALCVVGAFLYRMPGQVMTRMLRTRNRLFRHVRPPERLTAPILCIRTARDEAKLALDAAEVASMVGDNAVKYSSTLISVVSRFVVGAFIGLLGIVVISCLFAFLIGPGSTIAAVLAIIAAVMAVALVFLLPFVLLAMVSFLFNRAALPGAGAALGRMPKNLAYGGLGAGVHSLLEVVPKPTPPGPLTYIEKSFVIGVPRFSRVLRHSSLYNDPQVLTFLASWIRITCDRHVPAKPPPTSDGVPERVRVTEPALPTNRVSYK